MRAIVVERAGGPEVLRIREIPTPQAKPGWVLIRVKAFGLNRAEIYTRQGLSPGVEFPRVIGIEAVGEVVEDGDGSLAPGQKVIALIGGMGRDFDGGYAEYTCVPRAHAVPIESDLDWAHLAAIPETFATVWGGLHVGLEVKSGDSLFVRGGSSSIGMAAITMARDLGLRIIASTRQPEKEAMLRDQGAGDVVIGGDQLSGAVRALIPEGVDKVLELVGIVTLEDSLLATRTGGIVCMTGMLARKWVYEEFSPMEILPPGVKLTAAGGNALFARSNASRVMTEICGAVAEGRYRHGLHKQFAFEDIAEAHRYMESDQAIGKLVVVVD